MFLSINIDEPATVLVYFFFSILWYKHVPCITLLTYQRLSFEVGTSKFLVHVLVNMTKIEWYCYGQNCRETIRMLIHNNMSIYYHINICIKLSVRSYSPGNFPDIVFFKLHQYHKALIKWSWSYQHIFYFEEFLQFIFIHVFIFMSHSAQQYETI